MIGWLSLLVAMCVAFAGYFKLATGYNGGLLLSFLLTEAFCFGLAWLLRKLLPTYC